MVKFFVKESKLHALLQLPLVIDSNEVESQIAEFKKLLANASESEVFAQDTSGETVLHLMAKNSVFSGLAKEVITKYPLLVSIRNNAGIYPIHTAILNKNHELLEFLLSKAGPRTDTRDRTIIHYAVNASPEILKLCCDAAPQLIGETDGEGCTALERAMDSGNTSAQQILLTKITPSQDGVNL